MHSPVETYKTYNKNNNNADIYLELTVVQNALC